jgi:uncharacterized protein YdaU (DUF1376 family)
MSLPYFPMYPTDFDADTGHLTFAEDGAYNRLLRLSWRCPGAKMPDDMDWINRRARAVSAEERALVEAVIAEFFTRSGGKIFSARLAKEWQKTDLAHAKRVASGSAGGMAKALKAKKNDPSNARAMLYQPEPEPDRIERGKPLSLVSVRFEEFWEQYPHRGGAKKGKADAKKSWDRMIRAGADDGEIISGAMRYATDRQVVDGYAKNATTWINQKGWEDDVEPSGTGRAANQRRAGGSHDSMVAAFAFVANREPNGQGPD